MINDNDISLLRKLGLIIESIDYEQSPESIMDFESSKISPDSVIPIKTNVTLTVDESRFRSMCHLIHIVDMICESKNPAVQQQLEHLITLMSLTQEGK